MAEIPAALRELIETGPLAHFVTLNADGAPQLSVIWIGLDGDEIVSGHMTRSQKVRNVERDPRVVVSVEGPRTPGVFLAEHAVLRGRARVVEGGAYDLLNRLGKLYVGPDFTFPVSNGDGPADGWVLRTTVERIGGVGPWAW
jgi:PPOX class probable F420-dependent enzyme